MLLDFVLLDFVLLDFVLLQSLILHIPMQVQSRGAQSRADGLGLTREQYIVDANKAIKAIQNVHCEQFDCEKSAKFKSNIILQKTKSDKL